MNFGREKRGGFTGICPRCGWCRCETIEFENASFTANDFAACNYVWRNYIGIARAKLQKKHDGRIVCKGVLKVIFVKYYP